MPSSILAARRVRAAAAHFAASLVVACAMSLLVFFVWYPAPYSALAGGTSLFLLLVGVDVVLGPLLTGVVADPAKPWPELRRDLLVIVMLQLVGFVYGLYAIALARPVLISFEVDRFRVVTAADIESDALNEAPVPLRSLSWTGPVMVAAVKPADPAEQMRSVELGFAGIDLSMLPRNWRDYSSQVDVVWQTAKPVSVLLARYPELATQVGRVAARHKLQTEELRFLPLVGRRANWVALVAMPGARIVGELPVDGFP